MARLVAEGVRLPDDIDGYFGRSDIPRELLVPFMGRWYVHHLAADNFQAFVDAAKAEGIGIVPIPGAASAYRPYSVQRQLFLSRYTPCSGGGPRAKVWEGRIYCLKPGMAEAATPAKSLHGAGLAIDFMRDNGRAINSAERARLRQIGAPFSVVDTVKSENWHFAVQNADGYFGHPVTAPAAPAKNPIAAAMPVLWEGMSSMHVALVENIVRDRAAQSEVGPSTGVFDARLAAAVRNVQAWFGLPVTGIVDYDTWVTLLKLDGTIV